MSKEKTEEKDPLEDKEEGEVKVESVIEKVILPVSEKPKVNKEVLVKKPEGKKVRIIIDESDDENASSDVFLAVQGYAYQIRRGIPVEVPESVVEVLKHAIQTKMIQNMETFEVTNRDVPRYNYRILSQNQ